MEDEEIGDWWPIKLTLLESNYEKTKLKIRQNSLYCKLSVIQLQNAVEEEKLISQKYEKKAVVARLLAAEEHAKEKEVTSKKAEDDFKRCQEEWKGKTTELLEKIDYLKEEKQNERKSLEDVIEKISKELDVMKKNEEKWKTENRKLLSKVDIMEKECEKISKMSKKQKVDKEVQAVSMHVPQIEDGSIDPKHKTATSRTSENEVPSRDECYVDWECEKNRQIVKKPKKVKKSDLFCDVNNLMVDDNDSDQKENVVAEADEYTNGQTLVSRRRSGQKLESEVKRGKQVWRSSRKSSAREIKESSNLNDESSKVNLGSKNGKRSGKASIEKEKLPAVGNNNTHSVSVAAKKQRRVTFSCELEIRQFYENKPRQEMEPRDERSNEESTRHDDVRVSCNEKRRFSESSAVCDVLSIKTRSRSVSGKVQLNGANEKKDGQTSSEVKRKSKKGVKEKVSTVGIGCSTELKSVSQERGSIDEYASENGQATLVMTKKTGKEKNGVKVKMSSPSNLRSSIRQENVGSNTAWIKEDEKVFDTGNVSLSDEQSVREERGSNRGCIEESTNSKSEKRNRQKKENEILHKVCDHLARDQENKEPSKTGDYVSSTDEFAEQGGQGKDDETKIKSLKVKQKGDRKSVADCDIVSSKGSQYQDDDLNNEQRNDGERKRNAVKKRQKRKAKGKVNLVEDVDATCRVKHLAEETREEEDRQEGKKEPRRPLKEQASDIDGVQSSERVVNISSCESVCQQEHFVEKTTLYDRVKKRSKKGNKKETSGLVIVQSTGENESRERGTRKNPKRAVKAVFDDTESTRKEEHYKTKENEAQEVNVVKKVSSKGEVGVMQAAANEQCLRKEVSYCATEDGREGKGSENATRTPPVIGKQTSMNEELLATEIEPHKEGHKVNVIKETSKKGKETSKKGKKRKTQRPVNQVTVKEASLNEKYRDNDEVGRETRKTRSRRKKRKLLEITEETEYEGEKQEVNQLKIFDTGRHSPTSVGLGSQPARKEPSLSSSSIDENYDGKEKQGAMTKRSGVIRTMADRKEAIKVDEEKREMSEIQENLKRKNEKTVIIPYYAVKDYDYEDGDDETTKKQVMKKRYRTKKWVSEITSGTEVDEKDREMKATKKTCIKENIGETLALAKSQSTNDEAALNHEIINEEQEGRNERMDKRVVKREFPTMRDEVEENGEGQDVNEIKKTRKGGRILPNKTVALVAASHDENGRGEMVKRLRGARPVVSAIDIEARKDKKESLGKASSVLKKDRGNSNDLSGHQTTDTAVDLQTTAIARKPAKKKRRTLYSIKENSIVTNNTTAAFQETPPLNKTKSIGGMPPSLSAFMKAFIVPKLKK